MLAERRKEEEGEGREGGVNGNIRVEGEGRYEYTQCTMYITFAHLVVIPQCS